MIWDGRQQACQLSPAQDERNSRCGCGAFKIERANARMRHGAADEGRVQHAGKHEIGHVLTGAEEETAILPPQHRAPHMRRLSDRRHYDAPAARIFSAAAATERTMSR